MLRQHGFTGRIESTLEERLGRRIDDDLANLGRLLWFDPAHALHRDNTCAGCHSPTNGFGDTQSIAIGVDNNGLVGPNRVGPRNQRRSPLVLNTAFYPKLMWNGRFFANPAPGKQLGDPFSNMFGFTMTPPEGGQLGYLDHLLHAQAFIPPTELVEVAGFTGTSGTDLNPRFEIFDNGRGLNVPLADESGFRNHPIREEVVGILNGFQGYRQAFSKIFREVKHHAPIDYDMFAKAIAEFEFTLTFATAPIDRFARGQHGAMTDAEKRGALVFFGEGKCITCHATGGQSAEMFSDFENHVAGIPQLAPSFGRGTSNMIYDGEGEDEDFGAMQVSGDPSDKYKFRTAPLRNIALAPAFFHNGAFARLEDAIRFHLNPSQDYDPSIAGIDRDLTRRMGPRIAEVVPASYIQEWRHQPVGITDRRCDAVREDRPARPAREKRETVRDDPEVRPQQAEDADVRGMRVQILVSRFQLPESHSSLPPQTCLSDRYRYQQQCARGKRCAPL